MKLAVKQINNKSDLFTSSWVHTTTNTHEIVLINTQMAKLYKWKSYQNRNLLFYLVVCWLFQTAFFALTVHWLANLCQTACYQKWLGQIYVDYVGSTFNLQVWRHNHVKLLLNTWNTINYAYAVNSASLSSLPKNCKKVIFKVCFNCRYIIFAF